MSCENLVTSSVPSPPDSSSAKASQSSESAEEKSLKCIMTMAGDEKRSLSGDEKHILTESEQESEDVSANEEYADSDAEGAEGTAHKSSNASRQSRSYRPPFRGKRYGNQNSFIRGNYRSGRQNVSRQRYNPDKNTNEDSSNLFMSNWGHRSNLFDQNGNIQRATTELKNYIAFYKAKYYYYFDLVNMRYPQFVRKFENNLEIWRMSFNVYATGFSNFVVHLGEVHAFYQMEEHDKELRWVYKDFNFYPNKMRYGFRVNSYDIADIHSRFIKFICIRENIIKRFPYVSIKHKNFIYRKFDENVRSMLNRLNEVNLIDVEPFSDEAGGAGSTVAAADGGSSSSSAGTSHAEKQQQQSVEDSHPADSRFELDANDGTFRQYRPAADNNNNSDANPSSSNANTTNNQYRRRPTVNRRGVGGVSYGRRGRSTYHN